MAFIYGMRKIGYIKYGYIWYVDKSFEIQSYKKIRYLVLFSIFCLF